MEKHTVGERIEKKPHAPVFRLHVMCALFGRGSTSVEGHFFLVIAYAHVVLTALDGPWGLTSVGFDSPAH